MKRILILLAAGLVTSAAAQSGTARAVRLESERFAIAPTNAATAGAVKNPRAQATRRKGEKVYRTEAELRAAATTNLQARCVLDFRWRSITNQIAIQQRKFDQAKQNTWDERQRSLLQYTARQTTSTRSAAMVAAERIETAERRALAALELQKFEIERANAKLLRPSR